ncbi:MAG: DUF1343 domain-containing protein [Gemmatimonadetes bacterium]|nr:DUF1343 domain-containing protein [Gemmatimonadota bacterium]
MAHRIRGIALVCMTMACADAASVRPPVRPGVDVLLSDSVHLVAGRRVGLVTNQTGVDATGLSDVDRLLRAGVNLVALYSPEHGFRGVLDQEVIGHGVDSATGLPIYSLYGELRAPTAEMLNGVDVLLLDLQDIGSRTYTYISTVLVTMEAAGKAGVSVIVLDRPNPIGGELVQGPVLDPPFGSFVGMLPIPLRHGMTIGELARFGAAALGYEVNLTVVPAGGWRRAQWFDQTGLPWVRPSPNMPDLESATHYPGVVLFEATNLSVGRGTPVAFQVVGAPWLDVARVGDAAGAVPGVVLSDTVIRPESPPDGKYDGVSIPAVRLRVTDRARYDPVRMAVRLLFALRDVHGDSLVVRARSLDERAGTSRLRRALEAGAEADAVWRTWIDELVGFQTLRERYLLYH